MWHKEMGRAEDNSFMSARGIAIAALAGVALALGACGERRGDVKTDQSSSQRVSEALDPCAEGGDGFAQHVCGNRALSQIDTQVRDALVAEAADISDAGAQLLVQNQTRWREAARVLCGLADPAAAPSADQERCLQNRFRTRLEDAQTAVQQVGGYTFQRMELVDAEPIPASIAAATGGVGAAAVERNIRFPRIDGQQTAAIRRFNELVAQQPEFRLQDGTSEIVDYTIAYAGPEVISVRFVKNVECLGAANVTNTTNAVTVLMNEGRLLTAEDVFRAGSGWEDFITNRAVQSISREFSDYPNFPPRRDVYETATKPHLWLVTERGLTILFPPLSFGGSHADGGTEVIIPWADLRPYLNPAAPAPIRASA
jgi:hypothetical protein